MREANHGGTGTSEGVAQGVGRTVSWGRRAQVHAQIVPGDASPVDVSVSGVRGTVVGMEITRMQPDGLVVSPAFSHVAVVPAGATTIYLGGQNGVDATGALVSDDVAEQAVRAVENASVALAAAGASLADVVQWSVLVVADADLGAAYGAIAPRLAQAGAVAGAPPLVTAARVVGLGVPGALIEVSAVAAVVPL
ncbi:RidA family protein [Cellulomonas soli]|uniref:RidA family protein n=1 Tax=Cellulomonas soli TaxID=931535 RepID=UPI003F83F2BC